MTEYSARSRAEMAARVAQDIPEGWYVNLGIGVPTLVADFVPTDREVVFQSENGLLGVGPAPAENAIDPYLINAGKQPVTLLKGAALLHQADSFAMIRGGHIDLCVLGAFEVAANGDIANWARSSTDSAPAVGGAMDLAAGAQRVWVVMEHNTKAGAPRLVENLSYPATALRAVSRVYTNLAVFDIVSGRLKLVEMVEGLTLPTLKALTGTDIIE